VPGASPRYKQERKKENKRTENKKSLHKTLERAEGYSEIIHMGANREAPGPSGALPVISYESNKRTKH